MIGRQAYRRRPEIEVLFQSFLGGGAAVFTQGVADRERKAARSGADCLDQLLVHCLVEQLLHGTTWQLQPLGKVEQRLAAFDEHEFEQQIEQASLRDPGFLEVGGDRGRSVHDFGQLLRRQQPHGNQIVAEAAAFGELARQRRFDIGGAH